MFCEVQDSLVPDASATSELLNEVFRPGLG